MLTLHTAQVYKNFVEKSGGLDVGFQAEGLTGGVLLGVVGQGGISFFDWSSGGLVRRIEVEPRNVSTPHLLPWLSNASSGVLNTSFRSIGPTAETWCASPVRIPSTSSDSRERTMLPRHKPEKSRTMVSSPHLRLWPTLTRGTE